MLTDLAVVVAAVVLARVVALASAGSSSGVAPGLMAVVIPAAWMGCLVLFRTYEPRYLAFGNEEFTRVIRAATFCGAGMGALSSMFAVEATRGLLLVVVPTAMFATLASRYVLRRWLRARRAAGDHVQRLLLVGDRAGVEAAVRRLQRSRDHGLSLRGVCLTDSLDAERPGGPRPGPIGGVPVLGRWEDVEAIAAGGDLDAVAVLPAPGLDGGTIRRLGWQLEASGTELYVASPVPEAAEPRVTVQPVAGMPLLRVQHPELSGGRRLAKGAVDRVVAVAALVVLAPLLLAVAVLIRVDSRGPVFFRQARVGRGGSTFSMLKFRSMVDDAERLVIDLRDRHDGNAVLFKLREDPRVTRVGSFLRRWSLDELPQLVNVARGEMSLVGPRPPLAAEVALYGHDARRRLVVKPGITGLWQVSGRSDLDWDESVRLDLDYVENWSFAGDLVIMGSTVGAVLGRRGAY